MSIARVRYSTDPDLFAYQVVETLEVYSIEAADVLDQLQHRINALSGISCGGIGGGVRHMFIAVYGLDYCEPTEGYPALLRALIHDCGVLSEGLVRLNELSGPEEGARRAVLTELMHCVPWLPPAIGHTTNQRAIATV